MESHKGPYSGLYYFLIYINDIDDCIVSKLLKFADDTKVFNVVSQMSEIEVLRQDLQNLFHWSEEWLMLFNLKKCKVMHVGKNNLKQPYYMGGNCLDVVQEERDLGVIV